MYIPELPNSADRLAAKKEQDDSNQFDAILNDLIFTNHQHASAAALEVIHSIDSDVIADMAAIYWNDEERLGQELKAYMTELIGDEI